jgi:branched-chain amino acid transport system ATP-binding protein
VRTGQIVALLGSNGAGKSSVLKAISGVLDAEDGEIEKGTIHLFGESVETAPAPAIVKRRDGPGPRGTSPVCLADGRGKPGRRAHLRAGVQLSESRDDVYQLFPRLAERRRQIAGYLSGGEQQMVAIGRALMSQPKILALDEPSLGLAPLIVSEIFSSIQRLRATSGLTILLVEQNANRALAIADYAYIMENGRVVLDGECDKLRRNQDVREFYLGMSSNAGRTSMKDVRALQAPQEVALVSGTSGPILEVRNVSKQFGGVKAVNDVSLQLLPGQIVSLIGPNGAGKTTTFNLISGVLPPTRGQILFKGRDIAGLGSSDFAKLGIGRTFQNLALFRHGTVVENLLVGRHIHFRYSVLESFLLWGRPRREEIIARERIEQIIEFLEIEELRDKTVSQLSYGQQKRVELGRALASEPSLLLLDEIVAGMNREEKEDIARFILDIRDEFGIAVLMIEHDMQVVMDLSDRVYVLDFGSLIAEGTPAEVSSNPRALQAYLGEEASHA